MTTKIRSAFQANQQLINELKEYCYDAENNVVYARTSKQRYLSMWTPYEKIVKFLETNSSKQKFNLWAKDKGYQWFRGKAEDSDDDGEEQISEKESEALTQRRNQKFLEIVHSMLQGKIWKTLIEEAISSKDALGLDLLISRQEELINLTEWVHEDNKKTEQKSMTFQSAKTDLIIKTKASLKPQEKETPCLEKIQEAEALKYCKSLVRIGETVEDALKIISKDYNIKIDDLKSLLKPYQKDLLELEQKSK